MTQRVVDLSLPIDDNMPSHKLFQRPVHMPHIRHEDSVELGRGVPDDPISMATSYIGTLDHIGTLVDSFFHVLEMFEVEDLERAEAAAGVTVDGHIDLRITVSFTTTASAGTGHHSLRVAGGPGTAGGEGGAHVPWGAARPGEDAGRPPDRREDAPGGRPVRSGWSAGGGSTLGPPDPLEEAWQ
jgi:hypothetical protein